MKKLRVTVNGVSYDVEVEVLEDDDDGASSYGFSPATSVARPPAAPASSAPRPAAPRPSGAGEVTCPIAGVIAEVKVSPGDKVNENDLLLVIEAMKMHTNLASPSSGIVKDVRVKPGDAVQQGQVVVTFE